jgi:copper chaperone CopZ
MNNLLKEAIADAKAVRETAMANAKIALEEAFTPRLQSMLSARLAEEAEEETMEEEEEEMATEGYKNDEDGTPDPGPAIKEEDEMEMEEDLDLESIIRELEDEMEESTMEEEEEADAEVSVEPAPVEEEEEDVNIEEIIRALREEDHETKEEPVTEGEDEDEAPVAESEEESEDLKEAYRVIRFMKSKLNEVNLLNAKLLFSNKLFRNYSLNESQKMKVIENFDRAASIREVKLVYSTLCESFGSVGTKKKQQIKESYASKPAGKSTAPKKEILSEGFELAARWKKLANLK